MVLPKGEVSGHMLGVLNALLASSTVPDWRNVFSTLIATWEVYIQKIFAKLNNSVLFRNSRVRALASFLVKIPVQQAATSRTIKF